ncbi:hypothetical protein PU630_15455 [Microbacterium horticulturae]|uniref:Uncharacterized protein n=1 Tax=Microbacterium horticulturae TaxID=3028316 RepID=A0ABY8BWR1_9MICO|nr:hypothetical protein [Microbacterium sp. KACC 23027]WEG08621.1 hypothetical protein PU630_15455 [Microbacterium sp. KACC 23027]
MSTNSRDIVRALNAVLGPTLVAALAGAANRELPTEWVLDYGLTPDIHAQRRLAFAYH